MLRIYFEEWKKADIDHIYLFWWKINPDIPGWKAWYIEGTRMLWALLHEVFWNIPEVLAWPSRDEAHQHIRVTPWSITHIETPGVVYTTPRQEKMPSQTRLQKLLQWLIQ
jgi:hypothetical protein